MRDGGTHGHGSDAGSPRAGRRGSLAGGPGARGRRSPRYRGRPHCVVGLSRVLDERPRPEELFRAAGDHCLANDTYGRADQQESLEVSLFLEWAIAVSAGNIDAADYLEQVMSDELYAALDWWQNEPEASSPPTPFDAANPYYLDLPSQVLVSEGDALIEEGEGLRVAAEEADAVSDRFDLANVFFAVVLFVAGLTTIVQRRSIQFGFIALSVVGLVGGIAVLVTTAGWASLT